MSAPFRAVIAGLDPVIQHLVHHLDAPLSPMHAHRLPGSGIKSGHDGFPVC